MPQLYTFARFFPPYFSCPFRRFSILVFLSFSFIFSTPSWKWSPTLFVLELRYLFLCSSWRPVKKICQIVEEVWTITEKVVKSKDRRIQTKEWMAVWEIFYCVRNIIEKAGIFPIHQVVSVIWFSVTGNKSMHRNAK